MSIDTEEFERYRLGRQIGRLIKEHEKFYKVKLFDMAEIVRRPGQSPEVLFSLEAHSWSRSVYGDEEE